MSKNKTVRIKEFFDLCDKKNWFCQFADFDNKKPYIELGNNNNQETIKILIPDTIAYYLRTHWCGSHSYQERVEKMAKNELRLSLKDLLKEETIKSEETE